MGPRPNILKDKASPESDGQQPPQEEGPQPQPGPQGEAAVPPPVPPFQPEPQDEVVPPPVPLFFESTDEEDEEEDEASAEPMPSSEDDQGAQPLLQDPAEELHLIAEELHLVPAIEDAEDLNPPAEGDQGAQPFVQEVVVDQAPVVPIIPEPIPPAEGEQGAQPPVQIVQPPAHGAGDAAPPIDEIPEPVPPAEGDPRAQSLNRPPVIHQQGEGAAAAQGEEVARPPSHGAGDADSVIEPRAEVPEGEQNAQPPPQEPIERAPIVEQPVEVDQPAQGDQGAQPPAQGGGDRALVVEELAEAAPPAHAGEQDLVAAVAPIVELAAAVPPAEGEQPPPPPPPVPPKDDIALDPNDDGDEWHCPHREAALRALQRGETMPRRHRTLCCCMRYHCTSCTGAVPKLLTIYEDPTEPGNVTVQFSNSSTATSVKDEHEQQTKRTRSRQRRRSNVPPPPPDFQESSSSETVCLKDEPETVKSKEEKRKILLGQVAKQLQAKQLGADPQCSNTSGEETMDEEERANIIALSKTGREYELPRDPNWDSNYNRPPTVHERQDRPDDKKKDGEGSRKRGRKSPSPKRFPPCHYGDIGDYVYEDDFHPETPLITNPQPLAPQCQPSTSRGPPPPQVPSTSRACPPPLMPAAQYVRGESEGAEARPAQEGHYSYKSIIITRQFAEEIALAIPEGICGAERRDLWYALVSSRLESAVAGHKFTDVASALYGEIGPLPRRISGRGETLTGPRCNEERRGRGKSPKVKRVRQEEGACAQFFEFDDSEIVIPDDVTSEEERRQLRAVLIQSKLESMGHQGYLTPLGETRSRTSVKSSETDTGKGKKSKGDKPKKEKKRSSEAGTSQSKSPKSSKGKGSRSKVIDINQPSTSSGVIRKPSTKHAKVKEEKPVEEEKRFAYFYISEDDDSSDQEYMYDDDLMDCDVYDYLPQVEKKQTKEGTSYLPTGVYQVPTETRENNNDDLEDDQASASATSSRASVQMTISDLDVAPVMYFPKGVFDVPPPKLTKSESALVEKEFLFAEQVLINEGVGQTDISADACEEERADMWLALVQSKMSEIRLAKQNEEEEDEKFVPLEEFVSDVGLTAQISDIAANNDGQVERPKIPASESFINYLYKSKDAMEEDDEGSSDTVYDAEQVFGEMSVNDDEEDNQKDEEDNQKADGEGNVKDEGEDKEEPSLETIERVITESFEEALREELGKEEPVELKAQSPLRKTTTFLTGLDKAGKKEESSDNEDSGDEFGPKDKKEPSRETIKRVITESFEEALGEELGDEGPVKEKEQSPLKKTATFITGLEKEESSDEEDSGDEFGPKEEGRGEGPTE